MCLDQNNYLSDFIILLFVSLSVCSLKKVFSPKIGTCSPAAIHQQQQNENHSFMTCTQNCEFLVFYLWCQTHFGDTEVGFPPPPPPTINPYSKAQHVLSVCLSVCLSRPPPFPSVPSFTSHNIHYITPITRHCHANILPSTRQENNIAKLASVPGLP